MHGDTDSIDSAKQFETVPLISHRGNSKRLVTGGSVTNMNNSFSTVGKRDISKESGR